MPPLGVFNGIGTKLAILAIYAFARQPFFTRLNYMPFDDRVLEDSRLDFEGPGARFSRVLVRIFRDFGLLDRENAGTDFELAAKAAQFQPEARVARSSYSHIDLQPRFPEGRVGGGAPPGGFQ